MRLIGIGISIDLLRARAKEMAPSPVSFVEPAEKRLVVGRYVAVPSFGGQLAGLDYPWPALRRFLKLSSEE